MTIKQPESGDTITQASISEMHQDVASSLNSGLYPEMVGRAAVGPDQLYKGAVIKGRQYECAGGERVTEHVSYPETIRGPHWGTTGSAGTDNAAERERWQHISSYSSTGITGIVGKFVNIRCKGEGFSIFFWLNARISKAWGWGEKENKWDRSPYENGCRGWTSVIYYLRIPGSDDGTGSEITFKWSPTHMLGAFANEWNRSAPTSTKYKNFEYVHAYQDIQFISQKVINKLASYRGFTEEVNKLTLADKDTVEFGWEFVGAVDRYDRQYTPTVEGPGGPEGWSTENGQAFTVSNGNVGFMALRYESDARAALGHE